MNKAEYAENLNHPQWHKKREEVFQRFGKICAKCGSKSFLAVHHKTYASNKMPWEYPLENFEVLCEKCHKEGHSYEYTQNYCEECHKIISEKFSYCIDCHNRQVKSLKEDKIKLEAEILTLNSKLDDEKRTAAPANKAEDKRLQDDISRLSGKKAELEKKLSNFGQISAQMKQENMRIKEEKAEMEKEFKKYDASRQQDAEKVKSEISSLKKLVIAVFVFIAIIVAYVYFNQQEPSPETKPISTTAVNETKEQGKASIAPSKSAVTTPSEKSTPKKENIAKTDLPSQTPKKADRPAPAVLKTVMKIKDITREMVKGEPVTIVAKIESKRDHAKGHVFLKVSDSTGMIPVAIFADKGINTDNMSVGSVYKFIGSVNIFKDELEIIPNSKDDVIPMGHDTKITMNDLGKKVTIQAVVTSLYNHKDGHILLTVQTKGSDQELKVPIFNNIGYHDTRLKHLSLIEVTGEISKYKGALQVIPEKADDIKIMDND